MIRIASLVGVSSDEQAKEEKGSIPAQIEYCRKYIEANGGIPAGVYVMDGYSRTGYDSLADAMQDIPPLGQAIRDAEANQYDVLLLDNFDRLGDLGILVSTRFKKIKKILHSARQSGKIPNPENYDPFNDEASDISIGVGFLVQKYRLAKIQRGYRLGMEKRIKDGLHANNVPIGYIKIDKMKPLEIDPIYAPIIISMKDAYLSGSSLTELNRMIDEMGVLTRNGKRFNFGNIRRILRNPFYAGKTFFSSDRGTNTDNMTDGKHPPLWTWDEHLRIIETMTENFGSRRKNINTWASLLVCTVCGKRLKMHNGTYKCKYPGTDHITLKPVEADYFIPRQLVKELSNYEESPLDKVIIPDNADAIRLLNRKIEKIQQGYEADLYSLAVALEKKSDLQKQINALKDIEAQKEKQRLARERFLSVREDLLPVIQSLPNAIKNAPPAETNKLMRKLIKKITVSPQREFVIEWKDL